MFSGERIPDEDIRELLELANWAPNHRKTEPWRFHVVADHALQKLSDFAGSWYVKNHPGEAFSSLKHAKTKKKALQSSHVIAICMHRDPNESVPEWEEMAAVACAVQNIWLGVTAKGYGGYWSSPKMIKDMNPFFGLKENEHCMGLFYLGIPKIGLDLPAKRGDIDEKVTWHKA